MNVQNLIHTNEVYRRWAQRAFFAWSGYSIALLLVATLVDKLWVLSLPTLVIFAVIGIYANKRWNTIDFPRALARPVLAWTMTVMVTIMLYQMSPWMTESLAGSLIALFLVSLFFATAAIVLAVYYDKQFPPETPGKSLWQFLYNCTAIVASIGYVLIYAILWVFANDLTVTYGRWTMLGFFGMVAGLCLYEIPTLYRVRKAMFALWLGLLFANIALGFLAWFRVVPFGREISIDWSVTLIACFGMIHAAWAGKTIDPND